MTWDILQIITSSCVGVTNRSRHMGHVGEQTNRAGLGVGSQYPYFSNSKSKQVSESIEHIDVFNFMACSSLGPDSVKEQFVFYIFSPC